MLTGVDVVRLLWTCIQVCVCVCVCSNGGTARKVWPGLRFSTEITVSEKKLCGEAEREGKTGERRGGVGGHLVMICVYLQLSL